MQAKPLIVKNSIPKIIPICLPLKGLANGNIVINELSFLERKIHQKLHFKFSGYHITLLFSRSSKLISSSILFTFIKYQ